MASYQMLCVTGTHYELGFNIGHNFRHRLVKHYETYQPLKYCMEYYATTEGRSFCQKYIELCYKRFPHYMEELRGYSDATGIPLERMQVANLEREIDMKLREKSVDMFSKPGGKGCSDLLVNTADERAFGHNEDWDPNVSDLQALIYAEVEPFVADDGRIFPTEKFVANTFLQYLIGLSYSFNKHGLCYSVNYLFPSSVDENGSPENFLLRSLVPARNLDEAITIVTDSGAGISRGVSLNVGQLGSDKLLNIEVCLNLTESCSTVDVLELAPDSHQFHAHYNKFNRLHIPEIEACTHSSVARAERMASLKKPTNTQEIICILGDEVGEKYRFYRNNLPKDPMVTITSVLFDMTRKVMTLWTDNPRRSKPALTLPLTMLLD